MSTIAKTIVATGATSGIGFEAIKQLLQQSQPYKFILGARNVEGARTAFDAVQYDSDKHSLTVLPLELSNLKTVQTFARQTLDKIGSDKLDYLMLNAAINNPPAGPGPNGSKWSEQFIVNFLSQHYLTHLLRDKIVQSKSRVVVVSSGGIRQVSDPSTLEATVKAGSSAPGHPETYCATKFVQLLSAHWWRRQLAGSGAVVVAVSPGLIPGTGLGRGMPGFKIPDNLPDAKSVPEGGKSVLAAFTRDDFPEDSDRIFLTSWGEWWETDVIKKTLDKGLQDRWSFSKEQIEKEEGLAD